MADLDPGVWDDMYRLLNDRFSRGIPTTEDSVRYCFFHALVCTRKACGPNDVVLEYRPLVVPKTKTDTRLFKSIAEHEAEIVPRTQIDTVILRGKGDPDCAIEFKFHRKSTDIPTTTTYAGQLFHDFFRQTEFKKTCSRTTCYVVYVTDMKMQRYFGNAHNIGKTWYDLEPGEQISLDEGYFSSAPPTFSKYSGPVVPCKVKRAAKYRTDSGHVLVVDEVDPYLD